ncbi:universal stress protein [Granulosicoccus antarcticus]|nr:universal stress protein [Granulosicoccus antarcticus]
MFKTIAVPFDLAHADKQIRAIDTAADLAKLYGASLTLVGVTSNMPGSSAHNPKEFADKLVEYAKTQSARTGVTFETHSSVSHDIAIDLEKKLNEAVHEIGADLVVMASHVPGFRDYLFRSHASNLATHTDLSVMIVR